MVCEHEWCVGFKHVHDSYGPTIDSTIQLEMDICMKCGARQEEGVCDTCGGRGYITFEPTLDAFGNRHAWSTCDKCKGTKKVWKS